MQCHELERRLNALLDARRGVFDDGDVAAHLNGCDACRAVADGYALLAEGAAASEIPEPSDRFVQRVLNGRAARLPAARRMPSKRRWAIAIAVSATAASLIIALQIDPSRSGGRPPQPEARVAPKQRPLAPERILPVFQTTGREIVHIPRHVRRVAEENQLTGRFRPVTVPVEAAWEAFRRVLPDTPSTARGGDQETSLRTILPLPLV